MGHVFISHSHADRALVEQLRQALEVAGKKAWISTEEIGETEPFTTAISRAILAADCVLFVQTRRSRDRPWCRRELNFALLNNVPIVVAEVETLPVAHELKFSLQDATQIKKKNG